MIQGEKAVNDAAGFFEVESLIEDEDDIRRVSTLDNPPSIIAVCRIPQKPPKREIDATSFMLALDGIQDPGNLGTIIRTAHWFGIQRIFCSEDTVDLYNPKTILATMGSIGRVEVEYCSLPSLFDENPRIPVYGLLLEGKNIFAMKSLEPGFVLFGSEGHGPKPETLRRITDALTIPPSNQENHPDSLNVAIASAITLSQLLK